jgi:hypothetical protein
LKALKNGSGPGLPALRAHPAIDLDCGSIRLTWERGIANETSLIEGIKGKTMKTLEKRLTSAVHTIISTIMQLSAARPATTSLAKAAKTTRKRKKILCGVNGCRKPGRGPKYGWKCDAHATTRPKKKEQMAARKRSQKMTASGQRKTRTVRELQAMA